MDIVWPSDMEIDLLPVSALAGIDIPMKAHAALTVTGLPRNVSSPQDRDWIIFHSTIGDGQLLPFDPPLARSDMPPFGRVYLLATDQGTEEPTPDISRAFCLRERTGEVIEVDVARKTAHGRLQATYWRFANSSLPRFLSCLLFFRTSWPLWLSLDEADNHSDTFPQRRRFAYSYFRRGMKHRDPRVFEDIYDYWFEAESVFDFDLYLT